MKQDVYNFFSNELGLGPDDIGPLYESFVDSFGEPKTLWLSNYYFHKVIGQRKLMMPSQLFTVAILIVMMIMIIGGAK